MKRFLALMICAVMIMAVLAGCSCGGPNNEKTTTSQGDKSSETAKVVETTADGGTVEQDKDGNTIVKDKDGGIVSVTDSSGSAVDVDEYVASHPGTKKSKNAGKTSSANSSSGKSSKSSGSSKSKSSSKTSSKSSSSSKPSNDTEETIPQVVVTMPEDTGDMIQLD